MRQSTKIVVLLFLVFVVDTYNQDSKQHKQLSVGAWGGKVAAKLVDYEAT